MTAEKKQSWQCDDVLVTASHVQWVATNVFLVTVPPYKRRLSCELAAVGLPRTLREDVLDVVDAVVARVNRSRRIFLRQDRYATFPLEGYGDVIFSDSIATLAQSNACTETDCAAGSPCEALYSLQETLLRVGVASIIRPTIIRCAALIAAEASGATEDDGGDALMTRHTGVDDLHVSSGWLRQLRAREMSSAHTLWRRCRVVDVLRGDVYCVKWYDACDDAEEQGAKQTRRQVGQLPTLLLLAAVTCHDEATASGVAALRWAWTHVMHRELLVCVHSVERGDYDVALNTQITLYEQMDAVRGTVYDASDSDDKVDLADKDIGLHLLRAGHGFLRRSIDAAAPRPRNFHVLLRAINTVARATLNVLPPAAGADLDTLASNQRGLSRHCLVDVLRFVSNDDGEDSVWLRSACHSSTHAVPRACEEIADLPQGYGGADGLLAWAWRRFMWCGDIRRDPAQEPHCVVYRPLRMLIPLRDVARHGVDLRGYISAVRLMHAMPSSRPYLRTEVQGEKQHFAAVEVVAGLSNTAYRHLCRTIPSLRAADEIVYDPPPSAVAYPAEQTVMSFYRPDPTRTKTMVQMRVVARFYKDRDALRGAMRLAVDGETQGGDGPAAAVGGEVVVTVQRTDASVNLALLRERKSGWFLVATTVFNYDAQWGVFVKTLTSQAAYYLDREVGEGASWSAERDDGGGNKNNNNDHDNNADVVRGTSNSGGTLTNDSNDNEGDYGGDVTVQAASSRPYDAAPESELNAVALQAAATPAELSYRFVLSFYFPLQCTKCNADDEASVAMQAALHRVLSVQTQSWLYRDVCCLPVGVACVNGVRGLVGDVVFDPDGEPQSIATLLANAVETACAQGDDTFAPPMCEAIASWPMQDIVQRASSLLQRRQHEWLCRDEAAARLTLVRLAAVGYQMMWQRIAAYRGGSALVSSPPSAPPLRLPTRNALPTLHDLLIALTSEAEDGGEAEGEAEKTKVETAGGTSLMTMTPLWSLRLRAGECPLWRDTHTLPCYPVLSPAILPPSLPLFALAPFMRQFIGGNPIHHRKVVTKDDGRDTAEAHMDWAFMRIPLPQLPNIFRIDVERLPVSLRNCERALCEAITRDDPVTLCQAPHCESGQVSVTPGELLFATEPTFSRLLALLFLLQCPTGVTRQAESVAARSSSSTAAMYDLHARYCAPMEGEILTVQSATATLYRLPRGAVNEVAGDAASSASLPAPPAAGQAILFLGRGHTATNESLSLADETPATIGSPPAATDDDAEAMEEEHVLPFPPIATEARRIIAALAFETFTRTSCPDGEANGADETSVLLTSGRADTHCLMARKGLGPTALTQGTPLLYHPLPWLAVLAAPLVERREATADTLAASTSMSGRDAEMTRYIGLQYVPVLINKPTSKMYKISTYGRISRNFIYQQHLAALRAGEDVGAYLSLLLRRPLLSRGASGATRSRFADGLLTFYGTALEALYAHYAPRRALRFKLGSIAPQLRQLLTAPTPGDAEEDVIEEGELALLSALCRAARKILHVIDERFGGRATRVFMQMTAYVLSTELKQPFMHITLYAVPEDATLGARGGGRHSAPANDTDDGNATSGSAAELKKNGTARRRHVHAAFATHQLVLDDDGELATLRVTYDQVAMEFCCEWC